MFKKQGARSMIFDICKVNVWEIKKYGKMLEIFTNL
jgi:hypothetical protein